MFELDDSGFEACLFGLESLDSPRRRHRSKVASGNECVFLLG
jgi:hypothetical protein